MYRRGRFPSVNPPPKKKQVILLLMILGTVAPYYLDHSNVFYWKTLVVKDGGLPFSTTFPLINP